MELVLVLEVEGEEEGTRSSDVAVRLPEIATVGMLHEALVEFAQGHGLLPRTASTALGLHRAAALDALAPTAGVVEAGVVSGDVLALRPVGTRQVGRRSSRPVGAPRPLATEATGTAGTTGVVLDVVGGPDSGTSVALEPGALTVGRSPRCRLVVHDPTLSRHHLTLQVAAQWGGGVEVVVVPDASARNGVLVDGSLLDGPRPLVPGELLRAGDSVLLLRQVESDAGAGRGAAGPPRRRDLGGVQSAPPRPMGGLGAGRRFARQRAAFYEQVEWMALRVDEALHEERAERHAAAPDLAALGRGAGTGPPAPARPAEPVPLRLGLGEVRSRVAVGVAPGGTPELRRQATERLAYHQTVRDAPVTVDLDEVGTLAVCGAADQVRAAVGAALLQLACRHGPGDLVVAAALGDAQRDRFAWLKWLPHLRWPHVPLDGPGLAAEPEAAAPLVGRVLDLVAERVAWSAASPGRGSAPGHAAAVEAAVAVRPRVVLAVDHEAEVPRRLLDRLVEVGPRLGIHVLWFGEAELLVPDRCGAVLRCGGAGRRATLRWRAPALSPAGTIAAFGADAGGARPAAAAPRRGEGGGGSGPPVADAVAEAVAEPGGAAGEPEPGGVTAGAAGLGSVRASGARVGGPAGGEAEPGADDVVVDRADADAGDEAVHDVELDVDGVQAGTARSIARRLAAWDRHAPPLPRQVSLVEVDEAVRPWPEAVARRWRSTRGDGLACVLGVTPGGPRRVDLARHGPDVLVAGGRGSGKTAVLVAVALSLAVRHPPHHLRLVVLDCGTGAGTGVLRHLPHTLRWTAGADGPGAVREALDVAAASLPPAGPEPPPRLVVLVDDHAALARQVPWAPAVLAGLASTGAPARTHLVVTSPYPVDLPEPIWARTVVRLALRAPDPGAAVPVVGVPDPAHLPAALRGRGVLRIGTAPPVAIQCAHIPEPTAALTDEHDAAGTGAPRPGPRPEPVPVMVVPFVAGAPHGAGVGQAWATPQALVDACRAAAGRPARGRA